MSHNGMASVICQVVFFFIPDSCDPNIKFITLSICVCMKPEYNESSL